MSKVIFLDVDGVLNKHTGITVTTEKSPNGFIGVDKRYLPNLKQLVEDTGADIVLSSDWKDLFETDDCDPIHADADGAYLVKRLSDYGLTIKKRTDDRSVGNDWSTGRGYGIRKYLKENPDVEEYVILDDIRFIDFTGELLEHFVYCNSPLGKRNMKKAYKILLGNM